LKTSEVLRLIFVTLIVSSTSALVEAGTTAKSAGPSAGQPVNAARQPVNAASRKQQDRGQWKFEANCSRCHTAPEQLSPLLTGTVVRHMRVRANLSAQDERDILKFLAP
jgi:cytochrome c5